MPVPISYRGRFAPSPTGELHFGSLIAALGSWLDARVAGGEWVVRIEDVDRPRNVPGADASILRALEVCGLHWDGPVVYQSARQDAYAAALDTLRRAGDVYPCACSRSEIEAGAVGRARDGAWIYPGTCRNGVAARRHGRAWRLRVEDIEIVFADRLQGTVRENLAAEVGDFVLRRADGLFAYQLAVVVDDGWQGITDVVRGADLLDSTPRQIWLQRRLGLPTPRYLHLPVATNSAGEKLSKQTRAPGLVPADAAAALFAAMAFLGLAPLPELRRAGVPELLAWALAAWSPERLVRQRMLAVAGSTGSASKVA